MNKVAIASCWNSLDDLLKTDICTGEAIYCQFPLGQLGLCEIEGDQTANKSDWNYRGHV